MIKFGELRISVKVEMEQSEQNKQNKTNRNKYSIISNDLFPIFIKIDTWSLSVLEVKSQTYVKGRLNIGLS